MTKVSRELISLLKMALKPLAQILASQTTGFWQKCAFRFSSSPGFSMPCLISCSLLLVIRLLLWIQIQSLKPEPCSFEPVYNITTWFCTKAEWLMHAPISFFPHGWKLMICFIIWNASRFSNHIQITLVNCLWVPQHKLHAGLLTWRVKTFSYRNNVKFASNIYYI